MIQRVSTKSAQYHPRPTQQSGEADPELSAQASLQAAGSSALANLLKAFFSIWRMRSAETS